MLTPAQTRLLHELLLAPTIEAAAKAAGISSRTAYNYRQLPEFQAEYKRECAAMFSAAADDVRRYIPSAVQVLAGMMQNEYVDDADRIRAAKVILTDGLRMIEATDIEARLEALENAQNK